MRLLCRIFAAAALVLMLPACDAGAPAAVVPASEGTPTPALTVAPAPTHVTATSAPAPADAPDPARSAGGVPTPEANIDFEGRLERFDPANFDRPTSVDNTWFPLQPGTQLVYEGVTQEGGASVPHRVVFTVTDLTKVIAGVPQVVLWDRDYSAGELVEEELAFFAQANNGDVWHFGQYPEVYEGGKLVETPAWIAGIAGARPGITIKAAPSLGAPSYSQGWGPQVNWTDRAQVIAVDQEVCVPAGCHKGALITREFSREEPDAFQLKYYAPGVGNVRVTWTGADATQETLDLVRVVRLGPDELAQARARALDLEQRAYANSKDVYGLTAPLELPPPAPAGGATAPPLRAGDVIVYASELPESALAEFAFWDDPAAPGGKLVGTANNGGHLDPPPENDPHVTFKVPVQGGIPYRCWVHIKVGPPKGQSQANMLWVQLSDAVDQANRDAFRPDTGSYLTARGPAQEGWAWTGCDLEQPGSPAPLISFRSSGEITVRLQAGMEGVGFDQFLLSPERFLQQSPGVAVVQK